MGGNTLNSMEGKRRQHNIYYLEWEGDILRILTPTRFTPWNGRETY